MGIGETNASEPLMTHRKRDEDDTKTGTGSVSQEEHRGNLLTDYAVSGVQEA